MISINRMTPYKSRVIRKWSENFGGFTQEDKDKNVALFCDSPENKMLWERLVETEQRMPWVKNLVNSLRKTVEYQGDLTDKQKGLATSLYIDCCMTTDEKLATQVEARKLGFRLMKLELGQVKSFVISVVYGCNTRPFSGRQITALNNIAKRYLHALSQVQDEPNWEFDGWNMVPKTPPITEDGSEIDS